MISRRRLAEYLLLFYGVAGLYIVLHVPGGPIPVLLLAAVLVMVYMRRTSLPLLNAAALRPALPRVLGLWAVVSLLALGAVAWLDPDNLLILPRQQPWLWLAICVGYPLFSVYPQELLYRGFLMHRYGRGLGAAVASATAFGFAHLLFGNVIAVVATLAGGWLFARRYQQTGSLLVVSVEHALYGITIFTIGLGQYFYHAV
ncbi:CPBP family intramembrane glutamic endopeptidase [Actinoplanes sp. NPDC049596]|uniref:CPBP family intramembrane glutamic endopeptidase n=1 Tax=unclassified Actinoplanes TaxID=2626549 RepID=UPI00344A6549